MVTVILSGGLGNQMFQYAAARALSLSCDTSLVVDLYKLQKKTSATSRIYQLDVFSADPVVVSSTLKNKLIIKSFNYLRHPTIKGRLFSYLKLFADKGAQYYDDQFRYLHGYETLWGYFQNENYFRKYTDTIRHDFTFKQPLNARNAEISTMMEATNSIALHIRRGDYTNPNSNLPVLDIDYYKRAIRHINNKIENPAYFIFSDDVEWVKANLDLLPYKHQYITWNTGNDSYIDLQLMTCCKHNIIANSSFSWWGAWLNGNPAKLVIAPPIWYKRQLKGDYPEGFIPDSWLII
ncbi:MAG: hypothetical protein RL662_2099 [Bacteroidota bacterium]|jgi:hypothetical protein